MWQPARSSDSYTTDRASEARSSHRGEAAGCRQRDHETIDAARGLVDLASGGADRGHRARGSGQAHEPFDYGRFLEAQWNRYGPDRGDGAHHGGHQAGHGGTPQRGYQNGYGGGHQGGHQNGYGGGNQGGHHNGYQARAQQRGRGRGRGDYGPGYVYEEDELYDESAGRGR